MRALLNTLFVTTQNSYLARDGECVLVRVEQENKLRVPIHTLSGIVCFGVVSCSAPLLGLCAERDVSVSFLSEHGRYLARLTGPVRGNVLLRRTQYRAADNGDHATAAARAFVLGKVANCRTVLLRGAREHTGATQAERLSQAASELLRLLPVIDRAPTVDNIRGVEGEAAKQYFSAFDSLILHSKEHFFFHARSRRPPLDNVNALLSFLYTLLTHDVAAALETVGLDPCVGYLHVDRPGRPSLALDIMEELRPVLVDRLALALINRRQVTSRGFRKSESGAVQMDDDTRKQVLIAWQTRKQEEIVHPFLNERIALGLLPYVQALLLARYLRRDMDAYPPFFWK
ncbi:MAG TPA: type I-C CRISPR-associated endonuclease Cas1c [Candidatus Acidoferrales bacterium]|nr:type I-C CRISPR-associated endonuclease Cas1c [Candidatus Acidoferrales bacterium]